MKIFLSGNVNKISDETEKKGWGIFSEEYIKSLIECETVIINPNTMVLPNYDCNKRFTTDITALLESDIVILNATTKCGIGVGAELILAKQYKIPVFTISPLNTHYHKLIDDNEWIHSFLFELSEGIFENTEELCAYVNHLIRTGSLRNNSIKSPSDITDRIVSFDGGYDDGYMSSRQFWGEKPANAVQKVAKFYEESVIKTTLVLDAGCGHGKNSIYLSDLGFKVDGFDASYHAIQEARERSQNVSWRVCDIRKFNSEKMYDIILMTGSLHCSHSKAEIIKVIKKMQSYTVVGGYNVLSAFNSEFQNMSGHASTFHPTFLSHEEYLEQYEDWEIIEESSVIQDDVHPNNNITHQHSITRILAKKLK